MSHYKQLLADADAPLHKLRARTTDILATYCEEYFRVNGQKATITRNGGWVSVNGIGKYRKTQIAEMVAILRSRPSHSFQPDTSLKPIGQHQMLRPGETSEQKTCNYCLRDFTVQFEPEMTSATGIVVKTAPLKFCPFCGNQQIENSND